MPDPRFPSAWFARRVGRRAGRIAVEVLVVLSFASGCAGKSAESSKADRVAPVAAATGEPATGPTKAEPALPRVTPEPLAAADIEEFRRRLPDDVPSVVEWMDRGCHNCQEVRPFVEELTTRYAGKLKVYVVDIKLNSRLAREYGIGFTPTFMTFAAGGKPLARDLVSGIVEIERIFRAAAEPPEAK